ncbi:hypothetical protein BG003_009356 [Podila horticola]|nr:hypothetical protein BG003_009356 [Podila horticola]
MASQEHQRDVMSDEIKKLVKLLRFAVVQEHQCKMPIDYFMDLDAMEFYTPNVQVCIDILREERKRLLDAQFKLTKLIFLSPKPVSSSGYTSQPNTPSSSASASQQ